MKKIYLMLLLVTLIITGCEEAEDDVINSNADFTVTVDTQDKNFNNEQTFIPNDDMRIILSLYNKTTVDKTINFSTEQQFNFLLIDANDDIVWNWAEDQTFDPSSTTLTIPAGTTHTETITWVVDSAVVTANDDYTLEGYYLNTGITDQRDIFIR